MTREIRVKGQGFHGFLAALEQVCGRESVAATLAALRGDAGEAIRSGTVLPIGWYPIAWYRQLHATAQEATGLGSSLARDIGREATRHDLNTVYRLLLRMISPETLLKQANRILHMYADGGSVLILESSRGGARVRYIECYGCDRNVFEDMIGSTETMLDACGARNVRITAGRGGRVEATGELELTVRWD